MMKSIYSILLLCICCLSAKAQENRIVDDVVILNDRSEFKGEIIEYVPGSHVIIQTSISNPLRFSLDDVDRVVQASSMETGNNSEPFQYDKLYYQLDFSTVVSRNTNFGYNVGGSVIKQFSPWIGVGAGASYVDYIDPQNQSKRVALFASYKAFLQEKLISPFFQLNAGYAFNFEDVEEEWQTAYGDGYFVNPRIGIRLGTSDLMYTVFIGAHFHKTESDRLENPWGSWQNEIQVRRTELGVGFLF